MGHATHPEASTLMKVVRMGPRGWGDLVIGTAYVAGARLRLGKDLQAALRQAGHGPPPKPSATVSGSAERFAARVGFAITRLGPRMPFRADCLVQAFAAQRWLANHDIPSSMIIGARRNGGTFEAHAWLKVGDIVVTGGDISDYVPLTAPNGYKAKANVEMI